MFEVALFYEEGVQALTLNQEVDDKVGIEQVGILNRQPPWLPES